MSWSNKLKTTGAISVLVLSSSVFAQSNMAEPAWDDNASAQEMFESELDEVKQQQAQDMGVDGDSAPMESDDSIFQPVEESTVEESMDPQDMMDEAEVTDPMSEEAMDVYEDTQAGEPGQAVDIEVDEPVNQDSLDADDVTDPMSEDAIDVYEEAEPMEPTGEVNTDVDNDSIFSDTMEERLTDEQPSVLDLPLDE